MALFPVFTGFDLLLFNLSFQVIIMLHPKTPSPSQTLHQEETPLHHLGKSQSCCCPVVHPPEEQTQTVKALIQHSITLLNHWSIPTVGENGGFMLPCLSPSQLKPSNHLNDKNLLLHTHIQ